MDTTTIIHSVDPGEMLKMLTDIALVVFTAALAWATVRLAQHTHALAMLTDRLVKIETNRDARDKVDERRRNLQAALSAAEVAQKAFINEFSQRLNKPDALPLETMSAIETLHSFKQYINDADCRVHLDSLCSSFDTVRREKHNMKVNEDEIAKRLKDLQRRLQWSIDDWRAELASR